MNNNVDNTDILNSYANETFYLNKITSNLRNPANPNKANSVNNKNGINNSGGNNNFINPFYQISTNNFNLDLNAANDVNKQNFYSNKTNADLNASDGQGKNIRNNFKKNNPFLNFIEKNSDNNLTEKSHQPDIANNVCNNSVIISNNNNYYHSVRCLIVAKAYEMQENKESAKNKYRDSLRYDPGNIEAFESLINHNLLSTEEKKNLTNDLMFDKYNIWLHDYFYSKSMDNILITEKSECLNSLDSYLNSNNKNSSSNVYNNENEENRKNFINKKFFFNEKKIKIYLINNRRGDEN